MKAIDRSFAGTASAGNAPKGTPAPADEAALVSLARQGDATAFRAIMDRHNRRLFRVARGLLRDSAEAEDVVQETYLRAFGGLGGYTGASSLSTWLIRIAMNEALGRLRRRRNVVALDRIAEPVAGEGGERAPVIPIPLREPTVSDPEHAAARAEIQRLLEQAIDDLPDPFRLAFVLRFVEQMSVEETALCLGVPEETVKTRVHRAKRRLRATLGARLAPALTGTFPFAGARCARISESVLRRLGIDGSPPAPA